MSPSFWLWYYTAATRSKGVGKIHCEAKKRMTVVRSRLPRALALGVLRVKGFCHPMTCAIAALNSNFGNAIWCHVCALATEICSLSNAFAEWKKCLDGALAWTNPGPPHLVPNLAGMCKPHHCHGQVQNLNCMALHEWWEVVLGT